MRWGWLLLAVVLVGCGGCKKPLKPPPAQPLLAIVHTDPETFVDGGQLDRADIERRELHCGRPNNMTLKMVLPEGGRLSAAELLAGIPGLSGEVRCVSVVFVDGVESRRSNEVSFHCDPSPPAGYMQRCWVRE